MSFQECCKAMMQPPGATWNEIRTRCGSEYNISGEDVEWTQEVIAEIIEPTIEQATRMRAKYGDSQPLLNVMLCIIKENGGNAKLIENLLEQMIQVPIPAKVPLPKTIHSLSQI